MTSLLDMLIAGSKDIKDMFFVLKDSAAELSDTNNTMKRQACPSLHAE